MNRSTLLVLVALLGVFQLACERPPPEIERFTVTPGSVCPGAVLNLTAIILNGEGFTYQFLSRDFLSGPVAPPRIYQVGDVSGSPEHKTHDTRFCGFGIFCVQVLDAEGTVITESCQTVNADSREREESLTFIPDCPTNAAGFKPIDYVPDDPAGSQVVTVLRNVSRYDVILTHVGLDGVLVEERAGAGQPFTSFDDSSLYGSWSVVVDDVRFNAELQECPERGTVVAPPSVRAESIEMEMHLRCGDSSPACVGR